ncbi:hypothetical protein LCGC14_0758030 [marine sediment metagenome]|uniref:Uncharacterized protein n=1 Tax=marine sediment metagenome TaxID=412755 RepID=A0A0F9SM41_9ZZZZ
MDKGIEFTELMLRLILDGKIVGYRWARQMPDGNISTWFSQDVMPKHWYLTKLTLDYDSFNPGIKVGETWWFVGDIFEEIEDKESKYNPYKLIFRNAIHGFQIISISIPNAYYDNWSDLKKIGSIYDIEESNDTKAM